MKRLSYLLSILCALASFASFGQDTSHKALFKQVNKLFDDGKRQEGKALFVKAAELLLEDSTANDADKVAICFSAFRSGPFERKR